MASKTQQDVVKIVVPIDKQTETTVSNQVTNLGEATLRTPIKIGTPIAHEWAPAWFYSALSWLGQSYYDASNTQQGFNIFLAGANVDPYRRLGASRLFVIVYERREFFLSIAPDVDSEAPLTGDGRKIYPRTDAGILSMYNDLAASDIFPSVTHCYIPGKVGYSPQLQEQLGSNLAGYDPASGLRRILMGSAIAQVVPLGDFTQVNNEQVYDESPDIVPLATALVYDVTTNNAVGARTFVLPVAYVVDQATPRQYAVNRFGATQTPQQGSATPSFDYGQTAVFSGGPGFDATKATALTQTGREQSLFGGSSFITTQFKDSTAHTSTTVGSSVIAGVSALTCNASSPLSAFSNQQIVGFYRENAWAKSLGYPIYDYQSANSEFQIAGTAAEIAPNLVYDPAAPFLNGGALPNVLAKFAAARYVISADALQAMIADAGDYAPAGVAPGLSVMSAALQFDMSSKPVAGLANQLTIPVSVTVTTTPEAAGAVVAPAPAPVNAIGLPRNVVTAPLATDSAIAAARRVPGIVSQFPVGPIPLPVGQSGNTPTPTPTAPSTVQTELEAFVPVEALTGTSIATLPIGTVFATQALGAGTAFQKATSGVVLNLCDAHRGTYALTPIDLAIADTGLALTAGLQYIFSLQGAALAVRGSDGSTLSATPPIAKPDALHTYVGAIVYVAGLTSVRLYPILSLTLPAPAVGANGVEQGETYSLRLTYAAKQSSLDIFDVDQIQLASGLAVASPKPTDNSKPQPGDLYFGSFVGGAANVTLLAVPVFVAVAPKLLPSGTSFDGAMTLGAVSSGLPAYALQITDSSLFVFTNINVDTGAASTASSSNVFVAGIAINSSPDDLSAKAFAPTQFVLGLVRQAQMGAVTKFVFVPETDSVVIGGKRYMLSVIELADLTDDPSKRPYPPNFWPDSQWWQFANRHDPYLDIRYEGATEADRIVRAQTDTKTIAAAMRRAQEPLQMYLNVGPMTIWPIMGFPFERLTQTINPSQLGILVSGILEALATKIPAAPGAGLGMSVAEQIVLPGGASQANPYTFGVDFGATAATMSAVSSAAADNASTAASMVNGIAVETFANISGIASSATDMVRLQNMQAQQSAANLAEIKRTGPLVELAAQVSADAVKNLASTMEMTRKPQVIYGFSAYDATTGECYLIELVANDLTPPDRLPDATANATYDPYYVRVVFVGRLKAYNMSIIVPSIAYDQYGHLAKAESTQSYKNLLSHIDDFPIGYMGSLYDTGDTYDQLTFVPASVEGENNETETGIDYLYTNLPYRLTAAAVVVETFVSGTFRPLSFACRRRNWDADCTLMVSTHPPGTNVYLAFGGGDLVPMRLDAEFTVDSRIPAHLYNLTSTFSTRQFMTAQTISVANIPYVISVSAQNSGPVFSTLGMSPSPNSIQVPMGNDVALSFPTEIQVVGQASTTISGVSVLNSALTDTSGFFTPAGDDGILPTPQYKAIPYNNLVYLVRAVSNCAALAAVGGLNCTSGLLIDIFVPSSSGNLVLAQGARYKRSGLQYFGDSYTPTTMVDALDTLDFSSIAGTTFYAPTIFIPIPELDSSKGFVADIANFLDQQFWTFIYPEIVAQPGDTVNGVYYAQGFNLDVEGKPILSLQKLHFVYDPLAVLFSPNDLTHKYALSPKQRVLALTNGQIQEGICWRTDHPLDDRPAPSNLTAQQKLKDGWGMDRPNIIYSKHNRPVLPMMAAPPPIPYRGLSVNAFRSVSGTVYNIEESGLDSSLSTDQTGGQLISTVSSVANMVIAVLFDYDNDERGDLEAYDPDAVNKGMVLLNGYLGATGYSFSSPDHFDVNDVLRSQVPLIDQVANIYGYEVAFYNTDISLPRQYWSLTYDALTAPGLPNYIPTVPPSIADPTFSNRTRSLLLNFENQVHPQYLGVMDTFSSVVSISLHLRNGVTGSVFLNKKADRDVASLGSNPSGADTSTLNGLPPKYDFFLFTRDHYYTLDNGSFQLIDQGYAMCLMDDGTGTGNKVAKFYLDADGNYNELYTYVLYSSSGAILETNTFILKVTLAAPANPAAIPPVAETPNNVNPQDLVAQINKVSNLVYAVFGPASPGQPPAYIPIQAVGEGLQAPAITIQSAGGTVQAVQATPIFGAPGFNGYSVNVLAQNRQPVLISQIYSGNLAYPIAGSTAIQPFDPKKLKLTPFYGSLSHGLDKQISGQTLGSITNGVFGGNGQGSLIGTQFSWAFQGSGAIPAVASGTSGVGSTMKADSGIFYTFNAVTNTAMDSTGKSSGAGGGQFFIDTTDPNNPIWVVISTPKFSLNGNSYVVNLSTTAGDGVTPLYTLVVGGQSFPFDAGNTTVTVDRTTFTFNPIQAGLYSVSYASLDAPATTEAPTPISLSPFSMTGGGLPPGGQVTTVDVFNKPGDLHTIVLGVTGRNYSYDPVLGQVTITAGGGAPVTAQIQTGLTLASSSGYGYVIGFGPGGYTVNGSPMLTYNAFTSGNPASYPLMSAPKMFTYGNNFYTFDVDSTGAYVSVTGADQILPINPYQFSLNGEVYIINTNVQPYTVSGGVSTVTMHANNSQFELDGAQYTVALKNGSLAGATISGQFNIAQGNVIAIEDFIYQLDTLNNQIVGNGTAYPLTTSGYRYTITTANNSFTVTTEANADTVTIGKIVYRIDNTSVTGDGITYPILQYRTFVDDTGYVIGNDGVVDLSKPLDVANFQFTDGAQTYTVQQKAAFDGAAYYLISGATPQFTAAGPVTYLLRNDAVTVTAGGVKTVFVNTGALNPNQITAGPQTLNYGRPADNAAFDGAQYYAIANNQFKDTVKNKLFTLSANTAVCEGNSYEIFSNLGQGGYFEVPGGSTYYVNIPVADFGSASGDIYSVFPTSGGAAPTFTVPLRYALTIATGGVTIACWTATGGSMGAPGLTLSGTSLTGGSFTDPSTGIVYSCIRDGAQVIFIDSNNVAYTLAADNSFVAIVPFATAVSVAVNSGDPTKIYPVLNNSFTVGATVYTVNVSVASANPAGPFFPVVAGRFIVPQAAPLSNLAYRYVVDKKGNGQAVKGYVVSEDDEFSADGKAIYTVNAVNVAKASNLAQLTGAAPNQTVTFAYAGKTLSYALDSNAGTATLAASGLTFAVATKQFSVTYPDGPVTFTLSGNTVSDSRGTAPPFPATLNGTKVTFTDPVTATSFAFDSSADGPVTVIYTYESQFFIDAINGITYYIDVADNRVEALLYLPETTHYAFTPADGNTYLIHYNDVNVVFPVIAGANVNAGVATVGSDIFTIDIDEVDPVAADTALPAVKVNPDSFEINGELYTITSGAVGKDYSACKVVGAGKGPFAISFSAANGNSFSLTDSTITYHLVLDENNLPQTVTASFPVLPSRDLISVGDEIFLIAYGGTTNGSVRGQGRATIPIANSAFTLSNAFDSTTAKFIFADANIEDAGSVVGQFAVNQVPTFTLNGVTFTLDTVNAAVTDNDRRPYPLIANPMMFSINGSNYLIDTNQLPHTIVGNNNRSPLQTDVTVQAGQPLANSTFTLGGLIYAYVEDSQHNLLTVTGVKSYMIAQPQLTFTLDSSLLFTLHLGVPGAFVGSVAPIATITAGTTILNVYPGTAESGFADFFTYKNVLYTLVKSGTTYVSVQKSYTVYASHPTTNQQQLAVFDMGGTTYIVTDGSTSGVGAPAGITPGTMWADTALTAPESQFGLVYGLAAQPVNVTQYTDAHGNLVFQFPATDSSGNQALFDILYTPGGSSNRIVADNPERLPSFTQSAGFNFLPPYAPLTFETGGYSAFTTAVEETATPMESFSAAWNTPIASTDQAIAGLITPQGDFSLEFWHSLPVVPVAEQSVFTYAAGANPLMSYLDITFPDTSTIKLTLNDTVVYAGTTQPVFGSGWRHLALTYTQPYIMVCTGAPFVVADGSDFNFDRDFTILMTISANEIGQTQGVLYKGTGSEVPAAQTQTSFRVTLTEANEVAVDVVGSDGSIGSFTGPALPPGELYQVLITKHTKTPTSRSKKLDGTTDDTDSDPYSLPIDPTKLAAVPKPPSSISVDNGQANIDTSTIGANDFEQFAESLQGADNTRGYYITIAIRPVLSNGQYGAWENPVVSDLLPKNISNVTDQSLVVYSTGSANLLIGGAYTDKGVSIPFGRAGNPNQPGNIRDLYLFASAIRTQGIRTGQDFVAIENATFRQMQVAGLVGCWRAAYDPNGVVSNLVNPSAAAASSNGKFALLAPLPNNEFTGLSLYVNGSPVSLTLQSAGTTSPGSGNFLTFNAGRYRIQEISFWSMTRQPYQVIADMFGQLIPTNEPFLSLYLPGSFSVTGVGVDQPLLPLANYVLGVNVKNQASLAIDLGQASLDLQGCPAIGRCGPLITPNLYTPPGVALTVCDTVPSLSTYSVTVSNATGTMAGVVNEAYVFVRNNVLTAYVGKKVGDLAMVWVSQQQDDPQIIGFIEGAPPAPMANLTNKASYAGATSVSLSIPVSLNVRYSTNDGSNSSSKANGGATGAPGDSTKTQTTYSSKATPSKSSTADNPTLDITNTTSVKTTNPDGSSTTTETSDTKAVPANASSTDNPNELAAGGSTSQSTPPQGGGTFSFNIGVAPTIAPFGVGIKAEKMTVNVSLSGGITISGGSSSSSSGAKNASNRQDESNKYTVRLEGAMMPYSGDTFMASLNSQSVASNTVGTPASKTPILPNPNLGGFTTSNSPGALPKTAPTEERFGQRMFMPSPYGQAFVTSKTVDVYQAILLQTNTTYGFIRIPDPNIPRDLNLLSFRMSSKYIRPGVLDGMIGYQYNSARLASGATTWQTSTGQLSPLYDGNFAPPEVGHSASYMRVVEAYQIKKQIDQNAFNTLALYQAIYDKQGTLPDPTLTPGLDFYNEYLWSARGGTQERRHTFASSYEEVSVMTKSTSYDVKLDFNAKFSVGGAQILGLSGGNDWSWGSSNNYNITYTGSTSLDIAASFDGLENDTQMRYAANNDAHFVMNFNSTFNPANQSGLNLVIGSDGLVYNIVPSVSSGAGLPVSDDVDTSFTYQQPPPSYATGNADGLSGNLEPYDRPGKIKQFRAYSFYLQPTQANADDFWNTVVDPNWLANSGDPDALALQQAKKANKSIPWRLLYRVTYAERFLPPISTAATIVPQITPVFAVPVTDAASDFLFQPPGSKILPPKNPHNDIEANIVLVAPTASGLRIGTPAPSGSTQGLPVQPNNVIPFDIAKNAASLVNWGDSNNSKLLSSLTLSVTRQFTVPMTGYAPAGSTKVTAVAEPGGSTVYTVYIDPDGLTINVPVNPGIIVYQDVNSNPIQYFDGKTYRTLQADYIPTADGTITYYIQPPSTYDQTVFKLDGDDDLFGSPGDQWRYFLVSGLSSNLTASESLAAASPFVGSASYTAFSIADAMHDKITGVRKVQGYVLVQGMMQWPNLNVAAESFADLQVYKTLSVLGTFPIGDPEVLIRFMKAQYPGASFVEKTKPDGTVITPDNSEIELVFAKNITTYFNTQQQALIPQ
jgi:hypothetical protein